MKQTYTSVWDAIEATPQDAANMRAKSVLLMALQNWLTNIQGTQKEAAQLLGITQPRLSDLKRGHIDLFSLDTLVNMAASAGLSPTVHIKAPRKTSQVRPQSRANGGRAIKKSPALA